MSEEEKKRKRESEQRQERKTSEGAVEDYWAQCKGVEWFCLGTSPKGLRLEKFLKENSLMIKKIKKLRKKIHLTQKSQKKYVDCAGRRQGLFCN